MPNQTDTNGLTLPAVDVASTTSTTAVLTLGRSVYGNLATGTDADWYRINLVAGQTYDFRLLGVGSTPLGDTYLVLRDSAGNEIVHNDDAVNGGGAFGFNSGITFTATTTGTYFIDAQALSGAGSGGNFVVSAVAHNASGIVLTPDEIAWQLTNNFERYFDNAGGSNIPATSYDLSGGRTITYNVTLLTPAAQTLAARALQMWADVTGIHFVATTGAAQISFDDSEAGSNAYNNNVTTANGTITSSSLMVTTGWMTDFGSTMNSYTFETMIHELGHALGLGHGGNYNGYATFGTDNFYLNDSQHLSIMSYMQSAYDEFSTGTVDSNTFVNAQFRYVLTPMIVDIMAMQNLYGLSTTTRTGNTTYGYHSNTGNVALDSAVTLNDPANHNFVAFTIFDNGGIDTVDMSGFAGAQRIDLNQGASSDVLGGRLNMGIAYGTAVEYAIGGSGSDRITGNALANALLGGLGLDTLTGGAGNDTLNGGGGIDQLIGGVGNDVFVVDSMQDVVVDAVGSGTADWVMASVNYALAAGVNVEILSTANPALATALNLTGNEFAQSIRGNAGANTLIGNGGADTLSGAGGNDVLNGGTGADFMLGGAGDDRYFVDSALDSISEVAGQGAADWVMTSVSYALAAGVAVEILGTTNGALTTALNLTGNELAQGIRGNAGANILSGLGGNDVLTGGAGADIFVFNTGIGASNVDIITDYSVADDTIRLSHTVFSALTTLGTLAQANFAVNATGLAVRATDHIILETDTGKLFYDADGVGGAAGIQFATLSIVGTNLVGFNQSEFIIV